ncbi:MAG: hypothetical protein HLUCCA11_07410 [Phormidesmis priestleyi Ana]|uniref:Uncharacterized protein n=1 Tax=Phormidesmis priestleyi Ana TaxID=1666911 RepID=A0A0P7YZP0_9CYAN|nr:MAG: hypothetical protein HLUCCA11_07410 [Phormidesmis priestleyi Ana]
MWEWHSNPAWFNRPQASTLEPESGLTPEEQARLSEIDNVDALLEGLALPPSQLINPDGSTALNIPGATPEAAGEGTLGSRDNPFATYEEQYKFGSARSPGVASPGMASPGTASLGTASPLAVTGSTGNGAAVAGGSSFNFNNGLSSSLSPSAGGVSSSSAAGASSSVLSDALNRQQSASPANSSPRQPAAGATFPSSNRFGSTAPGGLSNRAPSSETSAESGIAAPFIRTTTEMSPPTGTTGYQAPASIDLPVFNVPPPQPSRNPYSGNNFSLPQQNFAQPAIQPAAPAPSYTQPSVVQPEQNRRLR